HLGLAAQLPFRADFAGDAGDFGGEGVELIDHRVDGVLQLEDLAVDVYRDLLREVAVGDGSGHLGDVADLAGKIAGHRVHTVGQVLPGPGNPFDLRLTPELALRPDFPGHAGDFGSKGVELIDHRVDGIL